VRWVIFFSPFKDCGQSRQVYDDIAVSVQHRPGLGGYDGRRIVFFDDARAFLRCFEIGPVENRRFQIENRFSIRFDSNNV